MRSTVNTFAGQLRHFAKSVDIVDDQIFDRVRELIYKYVKNELGAAYFELMREEPIDRDAGLKMFWSSADKDHYWRVYQGDEYYSNLVTRSFGQDEPLWVVGQHKEPLRQAEELQDEWSHNENLASYEQMADEEIRTLVVLPLRRKRLLGVYYFECRSYIGITDVAKTELQLLAEAVAILLELYEVNRSLSNMTYSAIFELNERLEAAKFPKLTRPHFFLAFPNKADRTVTTVILEVLNQFSDRIEFTDWSRMSESGNINAQIAKEITRSRFGICYFSEPNEISEDPNIKYVDNANVVFEAGMLHGRTAVSYSGNGGEPAGWIPMREAASPSAPFDFATERTLIIPRYEKGGVNEDRLRSALAERITNLLGED